jgi:type I restriction enzyme S subunit
MATKTNKKANVPNLRFPEFVGAWEEKILGDICKMQAGKFVSASEIYEKPQDKLFPCYGGNGLRGYTRSCNQNGVYSLIGRQGALCGNITLVHGKFHATEHAVVVTPSDIIDTIWMFHLLTYLNLNQYATGAAQPGLSVQNLERVETTIPKSKEEQQKISSFLHLIDQRIQTQNKIIENLETLIKGLSEKLFTGHLKFKDSSEDGFPEWKIRKMGDITFKVDKKNKAGYDLPVYSVSNINGFIPQSEQFDDMNSNDRGYDISLYKIVNEETFVYNPARINVGSIAYSGRINNVIVSSLYVCFKTIDEIDDTFFDYFLQTLHFRNSVFKNGEGGVRIYLFFENFSQITISLPTYEEQVYIASFLSAINKKIDNEKRLLQQYNNQKMYVVRECFI